MFSVETEGIRVIPAVQRRGCLVPEDPGGAVVGGQRLTGLCQQRLHPRPGVFKRVPVKARETVLLGIPGPTVRSVMDAYQEAGQRRVEHGGRPDPEELPRASGHDLQLP